jgi:hypothetical protein
MPPLFMLSTFVQHEVCFYFLNTKKIYCNELTVVVGGICLLGDRP